MKKSILYNRRMIFRISSIVFFYLVILNIFIFKKLPYEYYSLRYSYNVLAFFVYALPLVILSLLSWIELRVLNKAQKIIIVFAFIVLSGITFFGGLIYLYVSFDEGWKTDKVLYKNIKDDNLTITSQYYCKFYDITRNERTVLETRFLYFWKTVEEVDTTGIDSTYWKYVANKNY